jgi:predicted flap endonuclease-1-like 5' DNA nuclease
MWRKLSFYRQIVLSTIISSALVFLIVWIRRREQTTGPTIRLLPRKDTSRDSDNQKYSSNRVSAHKTGKILIPQHISPGNVTKISSKSKQQITSKKAQPPNANKTADDLTIILGIGPKTAAIFYKAGLLNFKDIAELDEQGLDSLLSEQAIRVPQTETWPEQASMAAKGDFKGLKELQATIRANKT